MGYSDEQVAIALLALALAGVVVLVVTPIGPAGAGYWLAKRQPPVNVFVRFCMVATPITYATVLVVSGYGELVSPDTGLPFYISAVILSLIGAMGIALVLWLWIRSAHDRDT